MHRADTLDLATVGLDDPQGNHRYTAVSALALPYEKPSARRIHVFDAQPDTFHQPEPDAAEQAGPTGSDQRNPFSEFTLSHNKTVLQRP